MSRYSKTYSEEALFTLATSLAQEIQCGDRIVLEGPMGAGKTTFTRFLLTGLQVIQPPEGSPSFSIAHEYQSPRGEIVHIDFYRLRSEREIEEAGIPSYYWERDLIVISEWLSSWPELEKQVLRSGRIWKVDLSLTDLETERRVTVKNQRAIF